MCGIAGIFPNSQQLDSAALEVSLKKMCDVMKFRGPDSENYFIDTEQRVYLGHRRLAIIDLDKRSSQPMISSDGRYIIVYNGEIYNYLELKDKYLSHHPLKTTGDTEVLLELFALKGSRILTELRGMFAFVIWDKLQKTVFMARDPYGIKPLYYSINSKGIIFASQVKSILASSLVSHERTDTGEAGYWYFGSVPEPFTVFAEISALPSGSMLNVQSNFNTNGPEKYWDINDEWSQENRSGIENPDLTMREAMLKSISMHLRSDVPIGVFLSGGLDSSTIAALMIEKGLNHLKGITISYDEFSGTEEDEVPVARQIARHYGIEHYVRKITRKEFMDDLPRIFDAMDQPSIDGINTWYASKAAAEIGLKVVFSGIGGDELLGGYPSFRQIPRLVNIVRGLDYLPGSSFAIKGISKILFELSRNKKWLELPGFGSSISGAYFLKRGLYMQNQLREDKTLGERFRNSGIPPLKFIENNVANLAKEPYAAIAQLESSMYLKNQLLRDSDWASMNHSIELRTPLVDAWLLRDICKISKIKNKKYLKTELAKTPLNPLPDTIVRRKKTGFGIPLNRWLYSGLNLQPAEKTKEYSKFVFDSVYSER